MSIPEAAQIVSGMHLSTHNPHVHFFKRVEVMVVSGVLFFD